ncbi:MAG: YHYH protein [Bacteroidota bacterium]
MKSFIVSLFALLTLAGFGQGPEVVHWLQNTTETGSYYVSGNPNTISNGILVNCQQVEYSNNYVYVTCTGVPAYPTGPFQDGNTSQTENQNAIFRFNRDPQEGSGNTSTTPGSIGVFINGVSLYDYRDGVAWDPTTNALCGGPGNPACPGSPGTQQDWNRDAIPAEMEGFDCSKGHPAMGEYHHHQNPSAFDLDQVVIYDVCNVYDADGLYAINPNVHSPLIGFAYDGFPIYGAYAYANTDGTGGIVRMKSGYQLRDITQRTHHADGTDVDDGPNVNNNYFLGYFREDYEYIASQDDDVLDEHNGRWCVTPEYPQGTYAYFCTVDEDWNSAYPYAVGPTFYGVYENASVNSITENTTVYTGSVGTLDILNNLNMTVHPNPASELLVVQFDGLLHSDMQLELIDLQGRIILESTLKSGSTLTYFDVQTLYEGNYIVRSKDQSWSSKVQIVR